jgi:hypothetical protein
MEALERSNVSNAVDRAREDGVGGNFVPIGPTVGPGIHL